MLTLSLPSLSVPPPPPPPPPPPGGAILNTQRGVLYSAPPLTLKHLYMQNVLIITRGMGKRRVHRVHVHSDIAHFWLQVLSLPSSPPPQHAHTSGESIQVGRYVRSSITIRGIASNIQNSSPFPLLPLLPPPLLPGSLLPPFLGKSLQLVQLQGTWGSSPIHRALGGKGSWSQHGPTGGSVFPGSSRRR